nr:unnamed protein product [Digitaria exilis]
MAGGGGSSRGAQARGRRKRQTPALPLDVLADIAARSVDPATVVRCAATCRDMRRRAADESFRRRLRLRHTAGRFVLPLLRGHLMGPTHRRKDEQYMVDTAAAAATTRLTSLVFPPPPTPPIDGAPLEMETFEPFFLPYMGQGRSCSSAGSLSSPSRGSPAHLPGHQNIIAMGSATRKSRYDEDRGDDSNTMALGHPDHRLVPRQAATAMATPSRREERRQEAAGNARRRRFLWTCWQRSRRAPSTQPPSSASPPRAGTCAADESFRRRRRLRHTGGRFVLPLLRGHLTGPTHGLGISLSDGETDKQYLIDTTAAAKLTRLVFHPTPQGSPHETFEPLDSRGGLILLAVSDNNNHHYYQERRHLRVCDPVTRHSHTFPLGNPPPLNGSSFVLLVGDQCQFQVLEAKLTLSPYDRSARCLRIRTFTSEHGGVWGPRTRIPTPSLDGGLYYDYELPLAQHSKPLVVGDVVHWLCLTQNGSYVLMLHVGATPSPRARVTTLPASFPRGATPSCYADSGYSYLLATATAAGSPVVLVADDQKISAWQQSKETKIWKQRPWTVIDSVGGEVATSPRPLQVKLVCLAETSGAVLIRIYDCGFFWLDLQSKAIVRQFSDPRVQHDQVYCSLEMRLSSWVPTFSCSGTL